MSGWHLTWQDPVALVVAVALLALAWGLRRAALARGATGCASCPSRAPERPAAAAGPADHVPLTRLSIGRPRR